MYDYDYQYATATCNRGSSFVRQRFNENSVNIKNNISNEYLYLIVKESCGICFSVQVRIIM